MTDQLSSENPESNEVPKKKRAWWKRLLRILGWLIFLLVVLFVLLLLFIRSPWGQDIIVGKATQYVSKKTNTVVSIDKLFITFDGEINLEGLYLEDTKGDTLVYSKKLEASIPLIPIFKGQPLTINKVKWEGLRANVVRQDSLGDFNFQFLIDAFVDESEKPQPEVDTEEGDPLKINVGNIDFANFKLRYYDAAMGLDTDLDLGKFHFSGRKIDLEKMAFDAKELSLENTNIRYVQTKPFPEDEDTTSAPLPFLRLDKLALNNVKAYYLSEPDDMEAEMDLSQLLVEIPKADLGEQDIEINKFLLADSNFKLKMKKEDQPEVMVVEEPEDLEKLAFEWPGWAVKVKDLDLAHNNILFQAGEEHVQSSKEFNPDYIVLDDLVFKLEDLDLKKEGGLKTSLKTLTFTEKASGLDMKELSFDLSVTDQNLDLTNLKFHSGNSKLNTSLKASYSSLDEFIADYEKADLDIALNNYAFDLKDIYRFAPDLKNNEYFAILANNKLSGNLTAKGNLKNLNVQKMNANWGQTSISTKGRFKNLTDVDRLSMVMDRYEIRSTKRDILQFVKEEDLGMKVPETVKLTGNLAGSLDDLKAEALLDIPEGSVNLVGSFSNKAIMRYEADVDVIDFDLGKLLDDPSIGKVQMKLVGKGEGTEPQDITAEFQTNFDKLEYNGYDFAALKLEGNLNKGRGPINISYQDDNLVMLIENDLVLDSLYQKVTTSIDVHTARLKNLKLMDKDINTDLFLTADFENDNGVMNIETHLIDGNIDYNKKTYILGPLNLVGLIKSDSTYVGLASKVISGEIAGNSDPGRLGKAVERQFARYYKDSVAPLDTILKPIQFNADFKVKPHPVITEVFVPALQSMDTLHLEANFDQKAERLDVDMNLKYLNFAGNTIEDFYFNVNSAEEEAQFIFGFEHLDAGAFGMHRTFFNGDLADSKLTLNFFSFDANDQIFYRGHSETTGKKGDVRFHLLPYGITLNNEEWQIPEENEIVIHNDWIEANDFVLSKDGRELIVGNNLIKTRRANDNIGVGFKDFELKTLLGLINSNEKLATGLLQGNLVVVNPMKKPGLLADFGIDQLTVMEAPLGDLSLKAFSRELNNYRFKMDLKGEDVDFETQGSYTSTDDAQFDVKFDLNKLGFKTVALLSQKQLKDGKGYLSGHLNIKGTTDDPVYDGFMKFNDASFKVSQLNSTFALTDDNIDIHAKGLTFNRFSIEDEEGHDFFVDGEIATKNLLNPKFDLRLNTKDFHLMDSSEDDSDLFYGKVIFGLDGTLKGSLNAPDVNLTINLNKDTDFTYVMSASQAAVETQEGVIEFVDKKEISYIIENEEEEEGTSANISGMDLRAKINIDKRAEFAVIIDPRTQDKLEIAGAGDLDFRMLRNGQMTLTGSYTVDKGSYRLSLYNLVKRKFVFQEGSSITWAGDPMDADLNFTALYEVKASASGLMGGMGLSEEDRAKYKQRLPFIVSLGVGGTIDRPELTFGLDMPEDSKGALDGSVYSRLTQLQNDEGEINKQVFSLLVLNQFFPDPGSDGGGGGFAAMARDNLTQALSDQLNMFSDQLTGDTGFKLNIGLDSYETYSGGASQQRTDLDITAEQRLFNDRLVVRAGTEMNIQGDLQPGEETPLLGNVSIEYLLTEDGRWRIRGFRKNEYENVIDGQVFTNGIGLSFQKDFSSFKFLWRSLFSDPDKYIEKLRAQRLEREKLEKQKKEESKKENKENQQNDEATEEEDVQTNENQEENPSEKNED